MFISETQEAQRTVNTHSWEYNIEKGPIVSLLISIAGADFGRWQKNSAGTAPVQDPHGLSAKDSVESFRDCRFGGTGNTVLWITAMCQELC